MDRSDPEAEDAGETADKPISKGLPGDWANVARGPTPFVLPTPGWRQLMLRYAGMTPAAPLDHIFKVTVGHESPSRALLESGYIDEDFRDEYINFYAKAYRALPSRCERIHFYDNSDREQQRYLGYVVLRPIIGRPVSRTMLSPPREIAEHVSCLTTGSATPWGYRHRITGFPFISQDSQFGSCAHAAIWMIGLYFHLRFGRPRYHLSDLARSARVHQDVHPSIPSGGLTPRQISAVLHDLEMTPVIYPLDVMLPDHPETIACRYLNSGLPVMVLAEGEEFGHAKVLIGYGRDEKGLFFIHHDDQTGPYQVTRRLGPGVGGPRTARRRWHWSRRTRRRARAEETPPPVPTRAPGTWHALVVPMPGRIYLSGEAAEKWGRLIFEETIEKNEHLGALAGGLESGRLRLRCYVTQASDYKRALRFREAHEDVVTWHTGIFTSHWMWVVEIQDRDAAEAGRRCVLGELAIDATSDENWVNFLFGNLPGLTMAWPSLGDDIEIADSGQEETPYLTGCALHVPS
jgi:Papain-like cysteine protease AvrRpt2